MDGGIMSFSSSDVLKVGVEIGVEVSEFRSEVAASYIVEVLVVRWE
jgi:hypothetical protein